MSQDGLLDLRRHGVEIGLFFVVGSEIQHRIQQVPQLLRRHLWNVLVEEDIEISPMRILLRIRRRQGHGIAAGSGNLDVLIPFLPMYRTAINVEVNVIVPDLDERDMRWISGL